MDPLRRFFSDKKVMVTGASGYLAGALVPRLVELGARVLLVSRKPKEDLMAAFGGLRGLEYLQREALGEPDFSLRGLDALFHLAAQTSVPGAETDPLADAKVNLEFPLSLLQLASQQSPALPMIFASTATVVGPQPKLPAQDGLSPSPVTIYDLHKSFLEEYVRYFARERGLSALCLRLANVYGPGKASSTLDRGILQRVAKSALQGKPITVFGSGEFLRDYVFIDDVVEAFLRGALHSQELAGRSCFVSSGKGHTVLEAFQQVITEAEKFCGKKSDLLTDQKIPVSKIDGRNFVGISSYLSSVAGWNPKVDFETGVALTVKGLA